METNLYQLNHEDMAVLLKNSLDAAHKAGQKENPFLHKQTQGLFPGDKLFWELVNCARENRELGRRGLRAILIYFAYGYLTEIWKKSEYYD